MPQTKVSRENREILACDVHKYRMETLVNQISWTLSQWEERVHLRGDISQ